MNNYFRRQFWFVICSLIFVAVVEPEACQALATSEEVATTQTSDSVQEELNDLRAKLDAARHDIAILAGEVRGSPEVLGLVRIHLAFIGVFLAFFSLVATAVGFWERHRLATLRERAEDRVEELEKSAEKASRAADKAVERSEHIRSVRDQMREAIVDIDVVFERLPELQSRALISEKAPIVARDVVVFEDRDGLLLIFDRLGLSQDRTALADYLVKVARFWRYRMNYARANERIERALELIPDHDQALVDRLRTLFAWSINADNQADVSLLHQELEHALTAAESILGNDRSAISHFRGLLCEANGKLPEALEWLFRAQRQDQAEAATESRPPDWSITYNLGCALTNVGDFADAWTQVLAVWDKEQFSEMALRDPDLAELRTSRYWLPPSSEND